MLDSVLQGVRKGDFCDGRLDGDLQLWTIEVVRCTLDDLIVFLVRVDNERIVGGVRGDPYILKGTSRRISRRDGGGRRTARGVGILAIRECVKSLRDRSA